MIYRRQRQQYIFAGLLAIIAVINILFFFILNRPARTEYNRLQDSIQQLRAQAGANRLQFAGLEKTSGQLDRFDKDKNALLMKHLIHRTTGYSQIVDTLDGIVQRTGVKKTRVAYNRDPALHAGLNAVAITIPLEGNYSNVVSFIHEIESSDTFFLITAIDLSTAADSSVQSAAANGTGNVSLSLALETYFYQ
jgi:Tfp pilus assembly protein PilO